MTKLLTNNSVSKIFNKTKSTLGHPNTTIVLTVLVSLTVIASFGRLISNAKAWPVDTKGVPTVKYYRQCDNVWGGKSSGKGGTICNSGSDATSAAMILSYYGKSVTPVDTASNSSVSNVMTNYGLVVSSGIDWAQTVWLLEKSRPVIIVVGPSIFASRDHYLVLKGKVGDTIYINDPSHPDITSASTSVVASAFASGTGKAIYARPGNYDPCGWNGKVCSTILPPTTPTSTPTPTPTPSPTASPTTVAPPTLKVDRVSQGDHIVTPWVIPTDSSNEKVQVMFRIRRDESNLTAAQKCATVIDSNYGSISSPQPWSDLQVSGKVRGWSFTNLEPGKYVWSARVKNASGVSSDSNLKFCYEPGSTTEPAYGWLPAVTVIVP